MSVICVQLLPQCMYLIFTETREEKKQTWLGIPFRHEAVQSALYEVQKCM